MFKKNPLFFAGIFALLLLGGCGNSTTSTDITEPDRPTGTVSSPASSTDSAQSDSFSERDPIVLVPSADGTVVYGNDVVTIDASHSSEGYVMVSYTGTVQKVKLQLTGTDNTTYTYTLHGSGYETFPLTSGSGTYTLNIYENISGEEYATAYSASLSVDITNEFGAYLYPNQYVNFDASMETIAKSKELTAGASSDLDIVSNVYNYIIENITYDYDKASSVQSGYLPVVDEILASKKGICFDYAAVMVTMLRVQNIPTRLEVGYAGETYHAWVSTYIQDIGWINGIIEFNGTSWELMDPTFAASSSSKETEQFITNSDNYSTKYVY